MPAAFPITEHTVKTARHTEQAIAAARATGSDPVRFAPLAMLLLRAEGVASSLIEGVRTSLIDLAAAEAGEEDRQSDLGLHHGCGKQGGEKCAGGDERGPLRSEQSGPERVGEKDAEAGIIFSGEAERQERRT